MVRSRLTAVAALSVLALTPYSLHADVKTDQKTRFEMAGMLGSMMNVFGGKAAREGVVSTVAIKGDRKATIGEQTSQIVDLNEEKVYDLDMKKKSYKVTTFAELRQKQEEARRKAEEAARKQSGDKSQQQAGKDQKEPDIDFAIKQTGQKKAVNGFDTHEVVMTVTIREKGKTLEQAGGMVMTSDMWMTDTLPGLKETAAFQTRYMQKLQGPAITGASAEQMAAAMAMYPQMREAMSRMSAEGAKQSGTPILTTTTMDIVAPADEAAKQQPKKEEEEAKPNSSGGLGGLFGSIAKKTSAKKSDDADKSAGGAGGRTSLMTITSEVLKVSTDVSAADVSIPAGFKETK